MKCKKGILLTAIAITLLSLTGCGGSNKVTKTNNDFNFEPTFGNETSVSEEIYHQTGKFAYDEFGAFSWTQYGYDDQGNVIYERINYDGYDDYTEIYYNENGQQTSYMTYDGSGNVTTGMVYEYNENGDMSSEKWYPESETSMYVEYTYDYDDIGKKTIQYEKTVDQTEPSVKAEYNYHGDGYLEREIIYYNGGQYYEEHTYDADGHVLSVLSYDSGAQQGYTYYEYDEYGNVTAQRFFSPMYGEVTLTFENEYDAEGNLIASTGYYPDGSIFSTTQNVYISGETSEDVYSFDELNNQLNDMQGESETTVSDAEFAQIEEKIFNGETVFTFGYKSSSFMHLNEVRLLEAGQDADGKYCKVDLIYDSEYGDFLYTGKVYYVLVDGQVQLTKCQDNIGMGAGNPDVDFDAMMADYVDPYLYYGRYCRTIRGDYEMLLAEDGDYYFGGGAYVGSFTKEANGAILEEGCYTTAPSDLIIDIHSYNFTITFCQDGLCETYYCRTLKDKEIIYICTEYDADNDMVVSGDIWINESAIGDDTMDMIFNAE